MNRFHDVLRHGAVAVLAMAGSMALATAGFAQDAGAQADVAAQHAGYAADSGEIAGVHTHLHHALNCLVGPDGDGFDASFGHPCDGMGMGALKDVGNANDAESAYAGAVEEIRSGLATTDVDAARQAAIEAQAKLTGAM